MPIAVKDYTWEETEDILYLTVPLKGVKPNKVDIFTTDEYLKVSYPPYLFECLLYAPVDDVASSAQVGSGAVVFKLHKQESSIWSQLHSPDAGDKVKMKERREAAIAKAHERAEQQKKEKAEKKREAEKYALNEQMKLEDAERKRIEAAKESERRQATEELERWKEQQKLQAEEEKQRLVEEKKLREMAQEAEMKTAKEAVKEEKKSSFSKKNSKGSKKKNLFEAEAGEAPLREVGKIQISFTPREFPTAARESTAIEEETWLKKQAETRKIAEIQDKDLTEEEKNPVVMRDKGNAFFKAGNYQAAVNAYSHAIRLDTNMPSLYSNRAACHLKMRNFFKSLEDSSKALELLTPPVPQNAASRCKAHIRRGTAFCELELYVEGLQDYEAALKIDPKNEQLKTDADRIRQIIQGSTS